MIVSDDSNIVYALKRRQEAMRREIDRRGIAMKAISMDSGVPYSSLLSYFPDANAKREPAQMPVSVLYALCGAVPEDILSLLLPVGRLIVRVPEDIDHDQIADAMVEYLADKQRAHRQDSECGPAIGPGENEHLIGKLTIVAANAA